MLLAVGIPVFVVAFIFFGVLFSRNTEFNQYCRKVFFSPEVKSKTCP